MNKDLAGRTKEKRIKDLLGEIKAYRNDDEALKEIVSHHIGVLWETILSQQAVQADAKLCTSTETCDYHYDAGNKACIDCPIRTA